MQAADRELRTPSSTLSQIESEGYAYRPGALLYHRQFEVARPHATAVVVHGLNEHSGRYRHLGQALAAWGIDTLAFDQRGFGRSSGARGDAPRFADRLDDVAWAITRQRARRPDTPLVLIGHSMGGLIVARYVQSERFAPDLLVLSGPAIDPRGGRRRALAAAAGRVLAGVTPRLRVPFGTLDALSTDPTVAQAARADPLWVAGIAARLGAQPVTEMAHAWRALERVRVPVLLLHGEADPLVPVRATRDAAPRLGSTDVTVRIYPGMLHEVFNEREKGRVFEDLRTWIEERAGGHRIRGMD